MHVWCNICAAKAIDILQCVCAIGSHKAHAERNTFKFDELIVNFRLKCLLCKLIEFAHGAQMAATLSDYNKYLP